MIKRMLRMMLVMAVITAVARGQQEKKIQAPLPDRSSSRNMKWELNNNVTSRLFQRLPASTELSFAVVSMELTGLDLNKKAQSTATSSLESTAGGSFVTIVQEDFEGAFPSGLWQVFDGDGSTNGEYYWGVTAYKSKSPSHSAWCAKGGANGLNPPAYYPNNCKSWMVYGPFDLSDANWAAVQFSFWIDTQVNYDYISWMASTNGTNFYGYSISGFGGETTWLDWLFNLRDVYTIGDVTGNSSVWIAFSFTSNSSITDRGVYLDDIILKKALLDTLEIVSSFSSPGSSPAGLAWDGTYLWNADWNSDKIYKLTTTGSIVSSFSSPGSAPNGLTWDGNYVWNTDWNSDKIYKLSTSGSTLLSFSSPGSGPDGLTWDGSYLWNSDFNTATIYKLTTAGSEVSSFPAPGGPGSTAGGLTWDGTNLWHSDWTTSIIYKLDPSCNILDFFLAPGTNPDGLTWDGAFLWNADFEKDKIYQLSVGWFPNYLVDIFPASQDSSASIGSTISYIETIKNIGQLADSYNLFLSGNLWPTSIWDASGSQQITNTGNINPGSQLDIQVKVTIPTTASSGDQDEAKILVTSVANPSISDSALIITRTPITIPWSDSFATTTLNSFKWPYNTGPAVINSSGLNEPSAPYSLNLDGYNSGGDEVRSQVIDLSAESKILLSYYYQRTGGGNSPESGDDLWVDYYNAAGNWINLRQYFGSGSDMSNFVKDQIILPADAYHGNFRIRFRNSATTGSYDDWFIDDVSLTGVPEITYSPQSFNMTLDAGDSTTSTLTIGNIGYSDLEFMLWHGSPEWLSFTPESGTVPPDRSQDIKVKFNAKSFTDDTTVHANIIIASNDPDSSIAIVPASMTVISTGNVFVSCLDTVGAPGDFIDIPVVVSDVTGLEIYSAGIKIQTDANILIPQGAIITGTIAEAAGWGTPNWGIVNGEITIAMAGSMPLTSKGVLVYLRYQVNPNATRGQITTINLLKVIFNEGQPAATTHDGSFFVHAGYDITGNIGYYYNDNPVANALVSLIGNTSQNTGSDSLGDYQFTDIIGGNYTLHPGKENDLNQAVSPFDASMILRYNVGTISLNPYQMIAADVSGSGDITAFDASLIQRYFVGLIKAFPVMPDTTHFWCFVPGDFVINDMNWSLAPDSIRYKPLNEHQKDQDYVGIIYGDVSGNWAPSTLSLASTGKTGAKSVNVSLGEKMSYNGKGFTLPIIIDNGTEIMSAGFTIGYNSKLLHLVTVRPSQLISEHSLVFNNENDEIRIALAGIKPLTQSGCIAELDLEMVEVQNEAIHTTISFNDISINEIQLAATSSGLELDLVPMVPDKFDLSQNYPNPFNPVTTIKYQLPERSHVVVKVLNVLGQEIRTLVNDEKAPGYYEVTWDSKNESGQSVTTGIYFYYIEAGDFSCIKKMALLR